MKTSTAIPFILLYIGRVLMQSFEVTKLIDKFDLISYSTLFAGYYFPENNRNPHCAIFSRLSAKLQVVVGLK